MEKFKLCGINNLERDSQVIQEYNEIQRLPPKSIKLEISSKCNFKCKMCYNRFITEPNDLISNEDFKLALKNIQDIGTNQLGMLFLGESTLHPKLPEYIFESKKTIPYVFLSTNGLLVSGEYMKDLMTSGLNSLKWSVNWFSEQSFAEETGCNKEFYFSILQNIQNSWDFREQEKIKDLKLYASIVLDNPLSISPEQQIFIKNNLVPYVDEIVYNKKTNHGGLDTHSYCSVIDEKQIPCPRLFNNMYIRSNLDVVCCCNGFTNLFKIGNLHRNSLKELWNCNKLVTLRKHHLSLDLEKTICSKIK